MALNATNPSAPGTSTNPSPKQQFLRVYEEEHARTMRVLRAYPPDQAEMRPHPRTKSARELAWIFAIERGLGRTVMEDTFASGRPPGEAPKTPGSWAEVLDAAERTHQEFGAYIRAMPDEELGRTVKFFVAPRTLGDVRRIEFLWFLLHDEIHHRGQFSIYLRMANGTVPSIYGPSGDEPWM